MTTLSLNETVTFEFKNDDYMCDDKVTFRVTRIEEKRIYLNIIKDGVESVWAGIGYTKFNKWMHKYKVN